MILKDCTWLSKVVNKLVGVCTVQVGQSNFSSNTGGRDILLSGDPNIGSSRVEREGWS